MAPGIQTIISIIPTQIWTQLKKFITKEKLIIVDPVFKITSKYTVAVLVIMICLSFANQFVRNVEIDCTSTQMLGGSSSSYGSSSSSSDLNNFCWNHETFLVAKALQPSYRGVVTYPGVSGYNPDRDELIRQRYYKLVWMVLVMCTICAYFPFFLWKVS